MGNGESVQSNPHFTDPYGGHLRSPNEPDEMYYPDSQSFMTNNGYHKQTNKSTKGSSPKSNRFEDTFSPVHSFNDFPNNYTSSRKYSDVEFENPNSLPNSSKIRRNISTTAPVLSSDKSTRHISRQPYYSIWSIKCSDSLSPQPRIGHFYATAPGSSKTYVGFGRYEADQNSSGSKNSIAIPTDEIWEFDHKSFLWKRIAINGVHIKEREESVATAITRNFTNNGKSENSTIIYVFGGKDKSQFYSDLLMIDTLSGTITAIKSKQNSPPNLAGAFISYYNNKIFIWGGYDKKGNLNQTLFIYDTQGNSWTSKLLDNVPGRCNASSVTTKTGKMLIYGGQKGETGLLEINLNTLTAQIMPTTGLAPIPDYNYGRLLLVKDTYLFYFGGKANNKYTMLYTLDLKRNWWFVFYIKPDNETVTVSEGKVNDNGLFLIPRIHSFGCCYSEEKDSIVAFLGHPQNDPPPLFILYMGDAFGFINLRDDMLTIMNQDPGDPYEEEVPIDLNC